ncbi:helix-turn-helix transcriptional regulator [Olivibacter sp. SDN3]|uniref:helix-turn-helix transcriptional regulator n=1 Tax=Olivibacter sp. SDN3 TaxID=2764720 RepID=UPI001650F4F0|nr:helix-turn-helix transcriptional regulator [Olivibacter sp. SDN3]QNL47946.1 helix-turn-helix transcriptional regulator [Olivibacter sp. SDN3]
MEIAIYTPTELLRPFIKTYKIIESREELVNRVVPSTSFAMAFRFRGQISYVNDTDKTALPIATFSGLRKSVRLINYAPKTGALIVLLKETGVSAFFKQPLHEMFEASVSLDNFFPQSEISIVEECLAETENNQTRIAIIEQFLYSKLAYHKPDPLVSEAITKIYSKNGIIRIRQLADGLYISQDAFEKRFRKVTGTTPKQFSSIVKMKAIIRQYPAPSSFLDIALENGYYDQPHFNKNFKLFTGQTPTDFFKSTSYW